MNKTAIAIVAGLAAGMASADSISQTDSTVIEWGFAGTGPVTDGPAIGNPFTINIAGASGAILDVNVTLLNGTHTWSDDLEIALMAPDGTIVHLMDDAGGSDDIGGDLGFDDQAAAALGDADNGGAAVAGVFQVSVYGTSANLPAATGTTLADFNGGDANGAWTLYVYDDAGGDTGSFQGGWRLDIETVPTPASAALLGLGGLAAARRRR